VIDPGLCVLHGSRVERAPHRPADLLALDEAGPGEDAEVLQDGRERHRERCGDLARRPSAAHAQHVENCPSRRIGEGREGAIERRRLKVNHMV